MSLQRLGYLWRAALQGDSAAELEILRAVGIGLAVAGLLMWMVRL